MSRFERSTDSRVPSTWRVFRPRTDDSLKGANRELRSHPPIRDVVAGSQELQTKVLAQQAPGSMDCRRKTLRLVRGRLYGPGRHGRRDGQDGARSIERPER
jgi:hypothetical protein